MKSPSSGATRFTLMLAATFAACGAPPPAATGLESKPGDAGIGAVTVLMKRPSELEQRVLGVYAHVNVTRASGIAEYRRLATYLRTVEGVIAASPFVYYAMDLAPAAGDARAVRRTNVLVKGIDPHTASGVLDLDAHLDGGGSSEVKTSSLTSDRELQPMRELQNTKSAEVIASTPDPRGDAWYEHALARWQALRAPMAKHAQADVALPTMFVGVTLADELGVGMGDVVTLVDPRADVETETEARRFRIAGTFLAGVAEYDSRLIYVHISELQWFKYDGKDVVSGVDLRLAEPYDAPTVGTVLRGTLKGSDYTVLEWQTLHADLFASMRDLSIAG